MNKIIFVIFVIILLLVGGIVYYSQKEADTTAVVTPANTEYGRVMDIETYVRQNISALSPEKEVLGGTFYVTNIKAANGRGDVEYEDGHNAFKADFTYSIDVDRGITIKSFSVHK